MQDAVVKLRDWFQHALIGSRTWRGVVRMHVFKPSKCQDQAQALSIQLALLRAVRLEPGTRVEVRLSGWKLKESVVVALQGLPESAGTLHLHNCKWPKVHYNVHPQLLVGCVPSTYTHWRIETERKHESAVSALLASLSAHRRALYLPHVPVTVVFVEPIVDQFTRKSDTDSE